MKDQVKVQRIGSEIQIQVRDQTLIIWHDDVAKYVAEELLKLTEPESPEVILDGTRVTIVGTIPADWASDWWPAGEVGKITGSFYDPTDQRQYYIVDFDNDNLDPIETPDYFFAEDFDIVGPR